MERVYKELGKSNVTLLLKEARDGRIDKHTIQIMASQMGGPVHGKFVEKAHMDAEKIMIALLQCWFQEELYKQDVDGYAKLIKILKDDLVHLSYLAEQMSFEKKNGDDNAKQEGKQTDNNNLEQNLLNHEEHLETSEERPCLPENAHSASDIENGYGHKSSHFKNSQKRMNKEWICGHKNEIFIGLLSFVIGCAIGRGGPELWSLINGWKVCIDFKMNCSDKIPYKNVFTGIEERNKEKFNLLIKNCSSISSNNENIYTNSCTRSLRVKDGTFEEVYKCELPQKLIPDLPAQLEEVVGIYAENLGLMVCGGRDRGYQPRSDHPRICYIHKLGEDEWREFCKLNTNRIGSYIKMNGEKIIIIGGHSSDPIHDCYQSQEVLDLDNVSDGWKEEGSEGFCFTGQLVEVPCISS